MSEMMTINFEIPEWIIEGLNSGQYERIGGVIIEEGTKQVVHWLKDSTNLQVGNLPVTFPSLGKVTLLVATFVYFHLNFKQIRENLKDINNKLDAQNFSKLASGFKLAEEAEQIKDKHIAKQQMIHARHLLEEGKNIFLNLFESKKEKDKKNELLSYQFYKLSISCELAIIKTYIWNEELDIAKARLLQLKNINLNASIYYIEKYLKSKASNQYKLILLRGLNPFNTFLGLFSHLIKKWDLNEVNLLKKIEQMRNENIKLQSQFKLLINDPRFKYYLLTDESQAIITFNDYLDGYAIEVEHLITEIV
ncbi:hypothetical protein ABEX78_32930 [Priestia megaterium]